MRRTISAVAVVVTVFLIAAWRTTAPPASPIEGAWVLASYWDSAGTTNSEPQRGLMMFTGTHYSIMYVPGEDERQQFTGDSVTDADLATAFRSFVANSGRYEVDGDQVTYRAFMAKNPNYMAGWPENAVTFTYRIEGDMLYATLPNGNGSSWRRVEGTPAPW